MKSCVQMWLDVSEHYDKRHMTMDDMQHSLHMFCRKISCSSSEAAGTWMAESIDKQLV